MKSQIQTAASDSVARAIQSMPQSRGGIEMQLAYTKSALQHHVSPVPDSHMQDRFVGTGGGPGAELLHPHQRSGSASKSSNGRGQSSMGPPSWTDSTRQILGIRSNNIPPGTPGQRTRISLPSPGISSVPRTTSFPLPQNSIPSQNYHQKQQSQPRSQRHEDLLVPPSKSASQFHQETASNNSIIGTLPGSRSGLPVRGSSGDHSFYHNFSPGRHTSHGIGGYASGRHYSGERFAR